MVLLKVCWLELLQNGIRAIMFERCEGPTGPPDPPLPLLNAQEGRYTVCRMGPAPGGHVTQFSSVGMIERFTHSLFGEHFLVSGAFRSFNSRREEVIRV